MKACCKSLLSSLKMVKSLLCFYKKKRTSYVKLDWKW